MNRSNTWHAEDEPEFDERQPDWAPGRRTLSMALPVRVQRAPAAGAVAALPAPASGGAEPAVGAMIVDDGALAQPGQVARTTFLAQLREQVVSTASEALGPVASVVGCPYIENWFRTHAQTPAAELDRMAQRYSGVAAPKSAADYIAPILTRLRAGIERWKTGENVADDAAAAGLGGGAVASPAAAPAANENGGAGAVQLKASGAGGAEPNSPAAVLEELGGGSALDAAHGGRLGVAMDDDFGDVRIHTDGAAARKAAELGARAFTVGTHVAFAAGEYRPGTPEGDVLLAHELAHVQQQRGGAIDTTARKKVEIEGPEGALEQEADQVAADAVTRLHGGDTAAAARAKSSLKSTLSLKRCSTSSTSSPAPAPAPPTKTASSGDPDLMKGTLAPDETKQQDVNKILNPTATGSAKPAKAFIPKNFQADMTAAMKKWMNSSFPYYDHLDKGGPDVIKLDMPQIRQTGKAAQQVVTAKWGSLIQNATKDPGTATSDPAYDVSDPKILHPQEDTIDKVSKADQDAMVRGIIEYGMRQADGGKPVATAHNLNPIPSRPDDVKAQNDFIDAFAKNKSNYAKLLQMQRMWPGEEHPWDHTVYIQQRRQVDSDLAKKAKADATLVDAQQRLGYWSSFQTLIHEFIHAAAHANYIRNEGTGSQDQILAEGGDDWLVTKLWTELEPKLSSDDALRTMVEGKKYPYSKDVIPALNRYDEWQDVDAFIKKLGPSGEQNFLAAYFLGHVELIGLGNWNKGMVKEIDTYPVIVADFPPSLVADRTFVDEATIRSSNGLGPTDNLPIGPAKVPGISWHYCIPKDNLTALAKQHGVAEDALKKANPLVSNWASLKDGHKLLIPKH